MEEHVVDTSTEHEVEVGLQLRETGTEVFREPGEGLAGRIGFSADVGSRRGILEHRVVAVVLARLTRVGTQSLDAEFRESEAFNLRDIDSSIAVNQVGR